MIDKKIVIAGGTGFIGRNVADYFEDNNEIVILTRNLRGSKNNAYHFYNLDNSKLKNIRLVEWNAEVGGEWIKEIDGSDLVINFAGKSVNCRYTKKNKKAIFDSRVNATKAIGDAINKAIIPPKLWINAASATIYRYATDHAQDELTGEMQDDFSVQVCKLWEKTFFNQRTPFTRKVAFRMAIALGSGGVMIPYFNLLKLGLGGRQGSGKQMYSWIHIKDVCKSIDFMFKHDELEGVYNLSAPNPVTNNTFMQKLRKATDTVIGLPAYEWMLKIGAAVIGTEPELILKSRWVVPTKLLQAGYEFAFPDIDGAFKDIVQQVPRRKYHLF
jgi:uncharacterized protein (TIGR01777 family)